MKQQENIFGGSIFPAPAASSSLEAAASSSSWSCQRRAPKRNEHLQDRNYCQQSPLVISQQPVSNLVQCCRKSIQDNWPHQIRGQVFVSKTDLIQITTSIQRFRAEGKNSNFKPPIIRKRFSKSMIQCCKSSSKRDYFCKSKYLFAAKVF